MGYVIQEGGLFPHLTAGNNVTLMARHLKWDRQQDGKTPPGVDRDYQVSPGRDWTGFPSSSREASASE